MNEQYRELIGELRPKFVRCVDTDCLIPCLKANGTLSFDDVNDVCNQESTTAKAEKLLDILQNKGSQAFQSLCVALETTYPHLLTVMFLGSTQKMGGEGKDGQFTRSRNTMPLRLLDSSQSSLTSLRSLSCDQEVMRRELHKIHGDKEMVHRRLTVTGDSLGSGLGTLLKTHNLAMSTSDRSLSSAGRDYMHDLQLYDTDLSHPLCRDSAGQQGEHSIRENEFYHNKHKSKGDEHRQETVILKKQYSELLADKHRLEQEVARLQRFREEDRKEVAELRRQQQDSLAKSGSGEAANQLYLTIVRKCEAVKEEYDALHKRYADLVASHSAAFSKLELTQEENARLRKSYDDALHERNAALHERNGLQQQCTAAIRQWDNALRERNEAREQLAKVQQQRDDAMKEINQAMAVRMKATKDLARLTEERNAAVQEYSLIMSERDQVHKEIERLQEELGEAQKRCSAAVGQQKTSMVESLRREISSALQDRDRALKECNDLREKYGDYETGREESQHGQDWIGWKFDKCWEKYDLETIGKEQEQERDYRLTQRESPKKSHASELDNLDQTTEEIEVLRKQVEKLQTELAEAQQEAEVCKRRRDWAFSERDKIVLERESIRTLCDKLRRERDRAVSDLAEALRDSDDIKRQRNEALKEVKELREKIEAQLEKESRMKQLNSIGNTHSRDSAIETDLQELEMETLEINIRGTSKDDIGFDIGGGKDDQHYPSDPSVYITSVMKGSPADGKLRTNDCILNINGVDVTSVERHVVWEALRGGEGNLTLVVRRRQFTSNRIYQTVNLLASGSLEHGITLKGGVYVSRIEPGSLAAREGTVSVGDRVHSINGKLVSSTQSILEVQHMLDSAGPHIILQIVKYFSASSSPPSSASSGHNLMDKEGGPRYNQEHRSLPSSPRKQHTLVEDMDEHRIKLRSSGVQTEQGQFVPSYVSDCTQTSRKKHHSESRSYGPTSQSTLLDKAYHKIFGDRRHNKEKKSSHASSISHSYTLEEDPIAELDSVLDHYSKPSKKWKAREHTGGTWPKYKGPPIDFSNINTVTTLQTQKRKERKSLANVTKQLSVFEPPTHCITNPSSQSHVSHLHTEKEIRSQESPIIDRFTSPDHSPVISPPSSLPVSSSAASPYMMALSSGPLKANISNRSSDHLDVRFNSPTSPESCLDYSVVSAHRDKDVLEYYKNKGRQRPRSAHYGVINSECLNPATPVSLRYGKTLSSPLEANAYICTDSLVLTSPIAERNLVLKNSSHLYPNPVPLGVGGNVATQNIFYTLSSGQRGPPHPHPHHPHSSSPMCVPLPTSSRYSSPQELSVFSSRSGDSLLSGSTTESGSVAEPQSYSGRYGVKDSGHYSFSPSPPGCPSQYSYAGPSPTQSLEFHHFHPITVSTQHPKHLVPVHSHIHEGFRSEDSCSTSPYNGLSTFPKRNQRIRIPSTPSVASKSSAGKMSTSSIEKALSMSERSSPVPPVTVQWLSSGSTDNLGMADRVRKVKPGDLRRIFIERSSEVPLGINISGGASQGIFISPISENSLAGQAGLQYGDQLLEVCGINMRSATYQQASNVLRQCGHSITMLVQYNPDKYREKISEPSSPGSDHTPPASPQYHTRLSYIDAMKLSNDDLPSSTTSTLTRQKVSSPKGKDRPGGSRSSEIEPRMVVLKKTTSNLGISLLGGNAVGIFVHDIQDDSPAVGPSGLLPGDQILEYNGVDLRNATAEEAAYELAKPADTVTVMALYNTGKYMEVQDKPGDSFYIRVLFDRPSIDGSLLLHKDDILFVDNTMYNSTCGLWRAWVLDQDGQKIKCGFIPSKSKVEEELMMPRNLADLEGNDGTRRGSTSARRSFFRRRRHHRSSSRDSKELASFSDVSINSCSDSGTLAEELVPPTYQRVERLDYLTMRPVMVVGPLNEAVVHKLEQDFPSVFQRCIPEATQRSQQAMERGLEEFKIVDYCRKGNYYECTTLSAVQEICDKNRHALIDVGLSAVDRLHRCQVFPIVIFLKFKSTKQIREVKDSRYLTEKLTTKAAKEMYEHALKIESEYEHLINAVIPGSNLTYLCTQIKTCVEEEQRKTCWVPCGSL
ncbi:disks large homolog 5-like isoform X3 [Limulus polyphemus]|uniref:Disks large homolog 5-like isoform X3 n=1 Tax=Limulus polyphemus TaxID=6850 RepID=A0ABM1THC7_LIMPO|nr:disks large homolog 5-like isoform X3 [Limulus polyphemus]